MQNSINIPRVRTSFLNYLNKLLEVPKEDPDARRRSKILNILLLGMQTLVFIALFIVFYMYLVGLLDETEVATLYGSLAASTGLIFISYFINRRYSEELAAAIFLFFLSVVIYFTDTPYDAIWGHNMVMMAIPIIMASVLLQPISSFIAATIINIFFIIVSLATPAFPIHYFGLIGNYAIAFVAWLSASTLENALHELRILNQDLDKRVSDRTKELQIANTDLRQARDKAIEASLFKSQLTAKANHELRTPLGSIIGFSEMLRGGHFGKVNENQKKRLTKIIDITNHLTKLINNWLDQAQLESGRLKINNYPFSVRELSESVADTMLVLTQEKELNFNCSVEKVPPVIFGDEDRLRQIMVNLIGNAIKYTDKGFIHSRIYLPDENHWAIAVKDSGCGISVDTLPFIFESFHQADDSRTRKHEGFGLGLSIVKQLVDLMEGEIYVDSQVNKGSTFTVVLPLLPVPEKQQG